MLEPFMYSSVLYWYQLSRIRMISSSALKTKAQLQNLLKHCESEARLNSSRLRFPFCLQTSDGPKVPVLRVLFSGVLRAM